MATGYDEEGIEEIVCVEPSGGTGFTPTAMCALIAQGDEAPSLTFGVADFSLEFWLTWAQGDDSPGADVVCWVGCMNPVGGPPATALWYGAAIRVSADILRMRGYYDEAFGSVGVNTLSWDVPLGWNHFVMNYDRSGNLDVYMNAAVARSIAINANAMAAGGIWPYVSGELDERSAAMVNNDSATWYGSIVSRMWQGPFAAHNRLLTAAEILESYQNRSVQNISAVTQVRWNPRDIEGHTGWETREDYIASLNRGLLHLPFGAPLGTYGTVIIPDSSGNGNDLSLPVAASYQNEQTGGLGVGSRARCCFIADPWWR